MKRINGKETMSITPAQLWNRYSKEKRACISCYYDYDDYSLLETCFPDIECVFFAYVDRGVYDWVAFGSALKKWFPSLKTLCCCRITHIKGKQFILS